AQRNQRPVGDSGTYDKDDHDCRRYTPSLLRLSAGVHPPSLAPIPPCDICRQWPGTVPQIGPVSDEGPTRVRIWRPIARRRSDRPGLTAVPPFPTDGTCPVIVPCRNPRARRLPSHAEPCRHRGAGLGQLDSAAGPPRPEYASTVSRSTTSSGVGSSSKVRAVSSVDITAGRR